MNLWNALGRFSVPIFLMCSGVLFLNKKELTYNDILKKYISRLLIAFIFWNCIYALYNANNVLMSSGNLPKTGVVNMANNLFLGYNESARYLLLVWFDDNGENQNEDMGKVIKAKINVESIQIRK